MNIKKRELEAAICGPCRSPLKMKPSHFSIVNEALQCHFAGADIPLPIVSIEQYQAPHITGMIDLYLLFGTR